MLRCTLSSGLAAGFYRLMLFYGHSHFYIFVVNVYEMATVYRRNDSWNYYNRVRTGYDNIVTLFLLLIGQKARNSGCDWLIQLSVVLITVVQ